MTFGDGLVIPSSGELAVLSSSPRWGCSAPRWLHGSTTVSSLVDSDAQKNRLWGWMKRCADRHGFGYRAPSCELSPRQRLGFTAGVWLPLLLSPQPPFEGIDGWFWQELFYFLLANIVVSAVCGSA